MTWSGGAGAVQKSDWSVLKNREVVIWPDNDKAGTNAAQKISTILEAQGNEKVAIVDLPSTLPHKWDLADEVPERVKLYMWNRLFYSGELVAISPQALTRIEYFLSHEFR